MTDKGFGFVQSVYQKENFNGGQRNQAHAPVFRLVSFKHCFGMAIPFLLLFPTNGEKLDDKKKEVS